MIKVKHVSHHNEYKLYVELSNGRCGFFDVSEYLDKGIFHQLSDIEYLKTVKENFAGICWPNGQDFSADTINHEMLVLPDNAVQSHYARR